MHPLMKLCVCQHIQAVHQVVATCVTKVTHHARLEGTGPHKSPPTKLAFCIVIEIWVCVITAVHFILYCAHQAKMPVTQKVESVIWGTNVICKFV